MKMQTLTKRIYAAIVLVLSLGLVAGCGTVSEIRDAIPKVSVDDEGGSVTFQGDDGESITVDASADGEIPEWLPSELPLPENSKAITSSSVDSGSEFFKQVVLTTADDFDTVVAVLEEGLAEAGLTPETREVADISDMRTAMFGVTVDGEGWMIRVVDMGAAGEDLNVSYATFNEDE